MNNYLSVKALGSSIVITSTKTNPAEYIYPDVNITSGAGHSGVRIEKQGEYYYLKYAHLGVKWDTVGTVMVTVDSSKVERTKPVGLCGNYDGLPNSKYINNNVEKIMLLHVYRYLVHFVFDGTILFRLFVAFIGIVLYNVVVFALAIVYIRVEIPIW